MQIRILRFSKSIDTYDALARGSPGFALAHCWAHVRRKYVEAEPFAPAPCQQVLDLIGQLYTSEAQVPGLRANTTAEDRAGTLALRAQLRAAQSRGIIGEIRAWAQGQRVLPRSMLGSAIAYMLGLWPGLTRFLEDPRIPLDNNQTERGIRGVVLGRKNHYDSRSQRGTEVAALFYSLIESAKLCGVDPKAYLFTCSPRPAPRSQTAPRSPSRTTSCGSRRRPYIPAAPKTGRARTYRGAVPGLGGRRARRRGAHEMPRTLAAPGTPRSRRHSTGTRGGGGRSRKCEGEGRAPALGGNGKKTRADEVRRVSYCR